MKGRKAAMHERQKDNSIRKTGRQLS